MKKNSDTSHSSIGMFPHRFGRFLPSVTHLASEKSILPNFSMLRGVAVSVCFPEVRNRKQTESGLGSNVSVLLYCIFSVALCCVCCVVLTGVPCCWLQGICCQTPAGSKVSLVKPHHFQNKHTQKANTDIKNVISKSPRVSVFKKIPNHIHCNALPQLFAG